MPGSWALWSVHSGKTVGMDLTASSTISAKVWSSRFSVRSMGSPRFSYRLSF